MKTLTIRDYRKKWAEYLATNPQNLIKAHQMVFGIPLDMNLTNQGLMFPFIDKDKITI